MKQTIKNIGICFTILMSFGLHAVVKKSERFSLPNKAMAVSVFKNIMAYADDKNLFLLNLRSKDSYVLEFDKKIFSFHFSLDTNFIELIFVDNEIRQKIIYDIKHQMMMPEKISSKGLKKYCEETSLVLNANKDGSRHAGLLRGKNLVLFESKDVKSVQVKKLNDNFLDCRFNSANEIELQAFDQTFRKSADVIGEEECSKELFEAKCILGLNEYVVDKITRTLPADQVKNISYYKVSPDLALVALLFKDGKAVLYDKDLKKKLYSYQDSVESLDFLIGADRKSIYFFVKVKKNDKEAIVLRDLSKKENRKNFSFKISRCKKYIVFVFADGSINVFDLPNKREVLKLDFIVCKKNTDEMRFFIDSNGKTRYLLFSFEEKPRFVVDLHGRVCGNIKSYATDKDKRYVACYSESKKTLYNLFLFDKILKKRIYMKDGDIRDIFYEQYQSFKFVKSRSSGTVYGLVLFANNRCVVIDMESGELVPDAKLRATLDGNYYTLCFAEKQNRPTREDVTGLLSNSDDWESQINESRCLQIYDKYFNEVFLPERSVKNYAFFKGTKGVGNYMYVWVHFADGSKILWDIVQKKAIPIVCSDVSMCGNYVAVMLLDKKLLLLDFQKEEVTLISGSGKVAYFMLYSSGVYAGQENRGHYLLLQKEGAITIINLHAKNRAECVIYKNTEKFSHYLLLLLQNNTLMVLDRQSKKLFLEAKNISNYRVFKIGDNYCLYVVHLTGKEKIYDLCKQKKIIEAGKSSYRMKCDDQMNYIAEGTQEADGLYKINVWKMSAEKEIDYVHGNFDIKSVEVKHKKEKVLELESKYKLGFAFGHKTLENERYLMLYSKDRHLDFTQNKNIYFAERWVPYFTDIDESDFKNANKDVICVKFKKCFKAKYVEDKRKAFNGYLIKFDEDEPEEQQEDQTLLQYLQQFQQDQMEHQTQNQLAISQYEQPQPMEMEELQETTHKKRKRPIRQAQGERRCRGENYEPALEFEGYTKVKRRKTK